MTLRWTEEIDRYLLEAWEGATPIEEMAIKLYTTTERVRWRLRALLKVDQLPRRGINAVALRVTWTAAQDRRLLEMWEDDIAVLDMARRFGRDDKTVSLRLRELLGVDVLPSRRAPPTHKIKVLGPPASALGAASSRAHARRRARRQLAG